jgi:alpha-L-rhamnosidase
MRGDPSMNSYNHYAYGAVADWIYRYAAGIDTVPADPGFHTILLHPNFDNRIGSLDFSYDSSYGTIHSAWSITGNKATWKLTIPANAKGHLPLPQEKAESYKLDGQVLAESHRVQPLANTGNGLEYELPSGNYQFEVVLP